MAISTPTIPSARPSTQQSSSSSSVSRVPSPSAEGRKAGPSSTPTARVTTTGISAPTPARPGPARLSVSSGVSKEQSIKTTAQKHPGILMGTTDDLGDQWFRCMIYGPTSSRKTTTAALFGSPEETRIILTRRKEQLRPLEGMGYQYALVDNSDDLEAVITHPESFWTDSTWVKNPNRTLVVDDLTEGVALLVDSNAVIGDKVVKDPRRSYNAAGKDLRQWVKLAWRAPQHLCLVCLEKTIITPAGERVFPELPPSMMGMVTTELEYVFYIKANLWRMLVDRKKETFEKVIDGKDESMVREIFAKNKQRYVPGQVGNGIFGVDEPMELRKIWEKIKNAKLPVKKAVGGAK